MSNICIIAAASQNNVIGREGKLPWDLPDDLKRFKMLTEGHTVIMGRKTHESIGKILSNRRNIVVTRQSDFESQGCEIVHSLDEAFALCGDENIFVIGGGEIYRQAFPYAHYIECTRVHTKIDGDAFFPEINMDEWELIKQERHEKDQNHEYAFIYETYKRITSSFP